MPRDGRSPGSRHHRLRNVNKWYETSNLRNISFTVKTKEVVVIISPSARQVDPIRTINRLEEHESGDIIVDGIPLTEDVHNIEAIRMETGMVFSSSTSSTHLTVLQNISLAPIKVRKRKKAEAETLAMQLLARGQIPSRPINTQVVRRPTAARRHRPRLAMQPRSCSSTSRPPPSIRR